MKKVEVEKEDKGNQETTCIFGDLENVIKRN